MRQFANVSISPWANPYSGAATNTAKNFYATAAATPQKQPVYRRIVAPPPIFYNTGVEQVIDDESDDGQADPGDAPGTSETPEAPPPASSSTPVEAAPTPADSETAAPEPTPVTEAIVEVPSTADADAASSSGDAIVEVVAISEDVKDEPPGPSDGGDTGGSAESVLLPLPPPPLPAALAKEDPLEPEASPAISEEQPAPASEHAPPPPAPSPPAPRADPAPAPEPVVVVESEKSGESERAAQEPPKSPTDKFVHFASDTKNPDAASIGKKKVQLAFGKGKANAFVRPKKPKPAPPATPPPPPKDEKKRITTPVGIMKKRERRGSILSVSSTEKPTVEESPTSIKTLLNKADERKKKKDGKDPMGTKEKKDGSPAFSDDMVFQEENSPKSDISDSVIIEEAEEQASESTLSEEVAPPPLPPNDISTQVVEAEVSEGTVEAEEAAAIDHAPSEEAVSVSSETPAERESAPAETSLIVQEPSTEEAPPSDESVADTDASNTEFATEVSETATNDSTTATEEIAPPPLEPDAGPPTESEVPAAVPATEPPEPSSEEAALPVEPVTEPEEVFANDDVKAEPEADVAVVAECTGNAIPVEKPQTAEDLVAVGDETDASAVEQPVIEEQLVAEEQAAAEEHATIEAIDTVCVTDDVVSTENVPVPEQTMVLDDAPAVEESPKTPVAEEVPSVQETSTVEETPVAEEIAAVEETPTIEQTSAAEATSEAATEAADIPTLEDASVTQETFEETLTVEGVHEAAEVSDTQEGPVEEEAAVVDEALAVTENEVKVEQPAVAELTAPEEASSAPSADSAEPQTIVESSSPELSNVQEESIIENSEDVEIASITEQALTKGSSDETAQIDEDKPSDAKTDSGVETAVSADLPPSEVEVSDEVDQEDRQEDAVTDVEIPKADHWSTDPTDETIIDDVVIETVEPQVEEVTETQDTEDAPAPDAIDNGGSTSDSEGDNATKAEDNDQSSAVEAAASEMKFDVFSKANFKPNASSNSVDSSPDPPVVHEELVEEAVESEFTQKASPGDTESAPDAATDVVVIVDTQSNEEAIDASPDPNEAVADTTNEGAEQNVSDWEKGDVSDIASIADPSETKPSEQLEAKKLPGDAQDEKSETPQERIGTVPEDDVGSTAEATEPVEVDDTAHPAPFDELLTSQVISASDEISLIDETIEQALVDIPDQGGADIANTDAGAQFVDTTTIQETLEAEPTPEQPDAPESLEPDAGAPEPEASIDEPQVDEPKPARTIPDAEDSEQPVDSSAPVGPDDVVAMETPAVDYAKTDEACASAPADATSEVSLDSAQEQADVNALRNSSAVDEALTVDVVTELKDTEDNPEHIDHGVAVAIVAIAEAKNSSAPDMPAEHTLQEVLGDDGSYIEDSLQPKAAVERHDDALDDDVDVSQHSDSESDSESEDDDWSSSEVSTHPPAIDVAQPEDTPAAEPGPDREAETENFAATEESQVAVAEPDIVPDDGSIVEDDASEVDSSILVSEPSVVAVPEADPPAIAEDDSHIEVNEEAGFEPPVEPSPEPTLNHEASSDVSEATSEIVPESESTPPEPTSDADQVSDITQDDDASEHVEEDSTIDDMTAQEPSTGEEMPASTKVITEHEEEDVATAEVPEPIEAPKTESDAAEENEVVAEPTASDSENEAEVVNAEPPPDEASEAPKANDAEDTGDAEDDAISMLDAEMEAPVDMEAVGANAQLQEETTEEEADISALPPLAEPEEPSNEPGDVVRDVEDTSADADDALEELTDIPEDAGDIASEPAPAADESTPADSDEDTEPNDDQGLNAELEATSEAPVTEETSVEDDVVEDETPAETAAQEIEPFAAAEPGETEPAAPADEDLVVEEGENASDAPIEKDKPDEEPEAIPEIQPLATENDGDEKSVPAEGVAEETAVEEDLTEGALADPVEPTGEIATEAALEEDTPVVGDAPLEPEPTAELEPPAGERPVEEESASVPEPHVEKEPQPASEPAVLADQVEERELSQEMEAAPTPSVITYATQDAEVLVAEAVVLTVPDQVQELNVSVPQVVAETIPIEPEHMPAELEAIATEDGAAQTLGQEGVSNEVLVPDSQSEVAEVVAEAASEEVPEAQQLQESVHHVARAEPPIEVGGSANLSIPQPAPTAASADDSQPRERDFAVEDGPANEMPTREKIRRRTSHSQRDTHYRSTRRRESELSTRERPTLTGMDSATPKSKRRDSMTERDALRRKERLREAEKTSSSSDKEKERAYPEYGSRHYRESKGDERQTKRHIKDDEEDDLERQKRREARRAEKERLAAAEVARLAAEEEARKLEHRERRRAAKRAEEELLRAKEARRKLKEEERLAREEEEIKAKEARRKLREEERNTREEEERRMRHEKRRQKHEAEKELRRLERERLEEDERAAEEAKRAEEEAKRLRRLRRAEREIGIVPVSKPRERPVEASRDAARRAAEEDDEPSPPTPLAPVEDSPRSAPRRRMSTRETPPNVKRGSLFGGIFGRSKPDPVSPASKATRPSTRARANTADSSMRTRIKATEMPEDLAQATYREKERPTSSHHIESSNESHDRAERPHRSRRLSHNQRRFKSAEEEEEYYKWKESRRYMRRPEHEMSGGRDGGVSLTPPIDDLSLPPPEPFDYGTDLPPVERPESPMIEDSAAVVGEASYSSDERRERRRTRRVSTMDERPKTRDRRISVVEKDRPVSRRIESDRPRTRDRGGDDRPRPRRGETEGRSSRKKKEESSGLFGRLKKKLI